MAPARGDVRRDSDLVPFRQPVFPVLVPKGVLLRIGRAIQDISVARQYPGDRLIEAPVNASHIMGLAIVVAGAFPGGYIGQVGRLLCGDVPLDHGDARITEEGDLAVAPVLGGDPFDEVVAVPSVLGRAEHDIPFRMTDPAGIGVGDRVALAAPETQVGDSNLVILETVPGGTPMSCHSEGASPGRLPKGPQEMIAGRPFSVGGRCRYTW